MIRTTLPCLAAAAILATGAAHAQAIGDGPAETINWYVNAGFQPYFILSGPDEGKGSFDQSMKLLMKAMPQYRHKLVEASLPRMLDSIKTRPNACSVALFKNKDREAIMDFSAPFMYLLPNGIVTMRKRSAQYRPFMNEHGEVRLEDFLADGKAKLALAAERSYGPIVDAVVKKHPAATMSVSSIDIFASRLLKLINQSEFDAIIGYAVELQYNTRDLKLNPQDFVVFPIAESSKILPLSVSCSKSELGKSVLAAVDRVVADKNAQREFDGFYRAWLDEDTAAYYERQLKQVRGPR